MNKRGAPQKYGETIIPIGVRLPESLLQAIDAAVLRDGAKNRSEWIVAALKKAADQRVQNIWRGSISPSITWM